MEEANNRQQSNCKATLQMKKHIKFMQRMIGVIPTAYSALDSSRYADTPIVVVLTSQAGISVHCPSMAIVFQTIGMTVLFFALSGLDVMNALDTIEDQKNDIIKWIYAQQVVPSKKDDDVSRCGFRGAPSLGGQFSQEGCCADTNQYEAGHIAMTYTALCCLIILGDDLSNVNKNAIINGLKSVQLKDGSFMPVQFGSENDTRFIYCASCISFILDDWTGIDAELIAKYIRLSLSYDHGIGQGPGLESHGGSTYCALASLVLLSKLESTFDEREIEEIKRWCLCRQKSGFQGRPNKPVDTCYSFWVGASLKLLGVFDMVQQSLNKDYLLDTQHSTCGGFSKWPDFHPDVLHTYFGLCGLSLMGESGLAPVDAALNITKRAKQHLEHLHQIWKTNSK